MKRIISVIVIGVAVYFMITSGKALLLNFSDIDSPSLAEKFSEVHFVAPGNDFGGSIFRLASKSISGGMVIDLNGATKTCTKLVRGLYYNSQRGKRLWPLDEYTLGLLQSSGSGYSELQLTGGLYTSCDDPYSIYGQITYDRSGSRKSYLIAGTTLDYRGNKYSTTFANSLQYFDNKTPIGFVWDSIGGIGFIGGELTDYNQLITELNNGGSIISGFTYSGSTIISSTGAQVFTASSGIDNASNTLRNLVVQGTVGLSQSLNNQERIGLLGNQMAKTIIYNSSDISNANIINEATQNVEKICKGKDWLQAPLLQSLDDILCFENADLTIDLIADASKYENKTIIVKNGNVIIQNTMAVNSYPMELFIDQGNLYLDNNLASAQPFDAQGYPDDLASANSGMFIRGNILINGLIIGGNPANKTGFAHKLHLQGKLSSFNSPLTPTTGRITLIDNLLGTGYTPYINLQNIFVRECGLGGVANDGSSCGSVGDISRTPLVILDGKYPSRLLGQ